MRLSFRVLIRVEPGSGGRTVLEDRVTDRRASRLETPGSARAFDRHVVRERRSTSYAAALVSRVRLRTRVLGVTYQVGFETWNR
jgi:hypothetical protein